MADRYTYLPHVGLLIAVVWLAATLLRPATRAVWLAAAVSGAAFVALLVGLTWVQIGTFRDGITLSSRALQVTADNYLAHDNLAIALWSRGDREGAAYHFRQAMAIRPGWDKPRFGYGVMLEEQGQLPAAAALYLEGAARNPGDADGRKLAGYALLRLGRLAEAAAQLRAAAALDPGDRETAGALADLESHLAQPPPGR
jgi:tetratricopeptide (TPR) repeat protein